MKPLTVNFIKSLDLNPLDYDLEMIGYKKVNGQWIYDIAVNVPWDFALLEIFLQKVSELDYDCKINYSYTFTIASDEVIDLFKSWYLKRTSLWLSREIIGGGGQTIDLFIKEDDDLQTFTNLVNDFNLLLQTISYPYEIKIHQVQKVEEEAEEDFSLSEDEDEVEADEEDEYEEEVAPHEDEDAPIYVDQGIAASEKVTNLIDEKLEKNLEIMKKERALARKRREYPAIAIEDITANDVSVDIDGIVFSLDVRPTRKNGQIYIIGLAKNGHAINAKKFCFNADKLKEDDVAKVTIGSNVRIKGQVQIDKYSSELTISIDFISLLPPPELRKETYDGPKKRIELHTHTKMSVMDGVGTVKGYLDLAENMGHKAIAFTDHGCVQAFPEIYQESKKHNVKVIYGAELYMIDTKPNFISNPSPILLSNATYTVFDLETTGLSERYDKIIEFGAIKVKNGMILDRINILINPGPDVKLSKKTLEITNITNEMLENEPQIAEVIDKILGFIGDSILV
jgi:DNA polymerase-3 subunit alpha (Gram-positive type)